MDTTRYEVVVEAFAKKLSGVNEEITGIKSAEDKWSLKEIVGHLVDSASNNHQRFVRLQFDDLLGFPSYDNELWISVQKYNYMDWKDITFLWHSFNRVLLKVVEHMNTDKLENVWILDEKAIPLGELVDEYYSHMQWHMRQFEERLSEVES